jgi:hypothetical protein
MSVVRSARVAPTSDVDARLGAEFGRVVNVSATGALLRMRVPFLAGRQCPLFLTLSDFAATATLIVRIVRTQQVPVLLPGAISELREYLVAVMFTDLSSQAGQAIRILCGESFAKQE